VFAVVPKRAPGCMSRARSRRLTINPSSRPPSPPTHQHITSTFPTHPNPTENPQKDRQQRHPRRRRQGAEFKGQRLRPDHIPGPLGPPDAPRQHLQEQGRPHRRRGRQLLHPLLERRHAHDQVRGRGAARDGCGARFGLPSRACSALAKASPPISPPTPRTNAASEASGSTTAPWAAPAPAGCPAPPTSATASGSARCRPASSCRSSS
jgi:hypothetical protein